MTTLADLSAIYPEIVLIIFGIALPAVYRVSRSNKVMSSVALVGVTASIVAVLYYGVINTTTPELAGLLRLDSFAALFMLVFLAVAFYVIVASIKYVEADKHLAEYYTLILLATVGMMVVASSLDLITLFVGLELASLATFTLVAFRKKDKRGAEAATKYFIIGGLSSALSLYGISLVYGVAHTTSLDAMSVVLAQAVGLNIVSLLAIGFLIAGFGYKVAIVPFHMWAPDVYEGAPTTVTALLAASSKKMGLAALFKIFLVGLIALRGDWTVVAAIVAVITMTVGNILALSQTNMKRMLAYSSIAQAGYMLIAIPVATQYGLAGGMFQIVTHAFMKGGAFIVVAALAQVALGEQLADYKGLAKRAPLLALSMGILLFSLAGIPPLSGFDSKFVLFSSAVAASNIPGYDWLWILALAGVLNSALSLYYYARVVKYMYVDEGPRDKVVVPRSMAVAIAICVVATVVIGVFPNPVIDFCQQAAQGLVPFLPIR